MKPLTKQRRGALLIAPRDVIVVTDRRGREWVSDRFTLVRSDLFKQPPVKNSGVFVDAEAERAKRGVVKIRSLLRGIHWDDTTWLMQDDGLSSAVGDDEVMWFKVGQRPIYTSAHRGVSAGYKAAGLVPRLHKSQGFITWWRPTNQKQHALTAVLMPRLAMPAPRKEVQPRSGSAPVADAASPPPTRARVVRAADSGPRGWRHERRRLD